MIEPIRGACFPCGEIPRHRKKAIKRTPKKADHKHDYESVVLSYLNPYGELSRERGFVTQRDYCAGRRCRLCGKLDYGFADGSNPSVAVRITIPWQDGTERKRILVKEEYRALPEVRIKDYWKLEKEERV